MEEFKVPNAVPKSIAKPIEEKPTIDPIPPTKSTAAADEKPQTKPIPNCPYNEPKWSACPPKEFSYKFEVLKTGQIIDEVKDLQEKPFWVFGRSPGNDIEMAHPTVSRFHAIFQYRPKLESDDTAENKKHIEEGWYIYDLGSTHGTFLNKMRIPPKAYIRVKVGHMLRLGASMRSYILQGPEFDQEPESEMSVTELKQMRINADEHKKINAAIQLEAMEREDVTWGMGEDADEETDLSVNPYASTNNEELFLDDPKKTLRGFFEREGLDLEYKCDEMSVGTFVCRIELPVDDLNGKQIVAEICHKGKKKDCVVQCALEACRILDRHGVLRQANHEPLKRKIVKPDSDDEDDFFDRTGDVERKKMRKSNPSTSVTVTYEDLLSQEIELEEKLKQVKAKMEEYQELARQVKESKKQQIEDLDTFMENLTDAQTVLEKSDLWKLQMEEKQLLVDQTKLKRLIQIAKPIELPAIISSVAEPSKKPKQLPMVGKRNQFSYQTLKPVRVTPKETKTTVGEEKELKSDEEEVEEEEEEELKSVVKDNEPTSESVTKKTGEEEKSNKLYGPAFIPENIPSLDETQEIIEDSVEPEEKTTEEQKIDETPSKEEPEKSTTNDEESTSSAVKRKRQRQRIRGKRENVDIEDLGEHEDTEKYAKWVPPENQSGDGITSLNDKFGY
ncbi:kanadaptin [Episyrphus balteatus]|uniref:kanadaptin n=1 Tax=Episyrphus balteatus TaxID=286459 RepID=UPI00248597D8|nr:kanadaptin [Episyrphus balteatus]